MRICSDQPCIVLLTEKDVWIRVNGKEPISLKANHMALLNCENNIIDVSSLNNTLVAHISHDIIKDYLRFLNKDLSQIPVWQRSATPILTLPCLTPDVFRVAAQHSMMPAETESEKERTRALLFTVLSRFLDSKKFLSLMMYMLRNCVSDSVYQIIESDIHKDWNLSMVSAAACPANLLTVRARIRQPAKSSLWRVTPQEAPPRRGEIVNSKPFFRCAARF